MGSKKKSAPKRRSAKKKTKRPMVDAATSKAVAYAVAQLMLARVKSGQTVREARVGANAEVRASLPSV